jgi:hypothetical protein
MTGEDRARFEVDYEPKSKNESRLYSLADHDRGKIEAGFFRAHDLTGGS